MTLLFNNPKQAVQSTPAPHLSLSVSVHGSDAAIVRQLEEKLGVK